MVIQEECFQLHYLPIAVVLSQVLLTRLYKYGMPRPGCISPHLRAIHPWYIQLPSLLMAVTLPQVHMTRLYESGMPRLGGILPPLIAPIPVGPSTNIWRLSSVYNNSKSAITLRKMGV